MNRSTNLAQGEDAILQGHLTLVDIGIYGNALQGKDRYKVQGMFCQIDWSLQQENPSTVAMFKDLRAQSTHCDDTMVRVDLWEIVQKARQYDSSKNDVVPVAPNGVAFHETRCGSTLTANLLAGFSPTQSRVYSESPPPIMAMKACDESLCNSDLHVKLIQDVFYLMGRRPRGTGELYYQFYKIQSVGTMYIQKFTAAFPDTPWIFLYRDSVEVMQSHTKGVRAGDYNRLDAVCTRYYSKPVQFTTTEQVINNSRLTMRSISKVQYCAAHLVRMLKYGKDGLAFFEYLLTLFY